MEKYDHKKIEEKWHKHWIKEKLYKTSEDKDKPKYYVLDMFPYPSGAGLHVGHPKGYIATDIFARAKMMQGYNVLHPMGWDAFGLPAENYAIQNKIHPRAATEKNIETFKGQLEKLGFTYDWEREINTTDPEYYKWTQWTFIKMFERGLAYESNEPINWCPKCQTGLSNEDLEDGKCERCGSVVEKKPMRQWMLKITDYADRLLKDLEKLPAWEESIKEMQRNWIGRSEGAEVEFRIKTKSPDKHNKKVLIGTRNEAKISMIRACFKGISGIDLISLIDIPPIDDSDLIEGDDCLANAKLKSEYYFKKTGIPTISTDHIFWLEKWPKHDGIIHHIRKLANPKVVKATDEEVINFLQQFLKKVGGTSKSHFVYAVSYTDQSGTTVAKQIPHEYILQMERSKDFWPGYPIESLLKDVETGTFKSEQKDEVRYVRVAKLFKEVFVHKITEIEKVKVFTTRPDTLFGATFMVISPEHKLIQDLKSGIKNWVEVEKYINTAKRKSDLERTDLNKEKIGVKLEGITAINPANNEEIPIFIADYVLIGYGTGAIMAVPAHDERDFEFAKKYNLQIIKVVEPPPLQVFNRNIEDIAAGAPSELKIEADCYTGDGININSDFLNGLETKQAKEKMIQWLEERGLGKRTVNYKLRDWVFSRQRYWGEPIPIVHCEACRNRKYNFIFIHGYDSTCKTPWKLWLKSELEKMGHTFFGPELPNTAKPNVEEQANFILQNAKTGKDTIIIGHSLGGTVMMKVLEKVKTKIAQAVFLDAVLRPKFNDKERPEVAASSDWKFDLKKIKKAASEFTVLADKNFIIIPQDQSEELGKLFDAKIIYVKPNYRHFSQAETEPAVLRLFENRGLVPVPEKDLPLKLPEVKNYEPTGTGESPLANIKDWVNKKCPKCGGPAKRETNTMPNWAGSSWYYLRYIDPHNKQALVDKNKEKYWSPVDFYVGGAEHATRHLIYARFWHKFLFDIGAVNYDEPFTRLQHVGLIMAEDGRKMSKRWGNVINPDEIVEKFGADTMRVYEMFMGPFSQPCAWSTKSLIGGRRFLEKIWHFYHKVKLFDCGGVGCNKAPAGLPQMMHKTIKKVTEDIENFHYNTAVSQMMIFMNFASQFDSVPRGALENFLKILAPFAPHLAEELWLKLGHKESIFKQSWPKYNSELVKDETINLVIQVNSKVRDTLEVSAEISEEEAKKVAMASEKIKKWLEGKKVVKIIFVKGKLINIVVK